MFQFGYPKLSPVTITTFYFFICFVFHKKKYFERSLQGQKYFCVWNIVVTWNWPPSPDIWLKHRSTMSMKGKLLHFSEKLLTEFNWRYLEVFEPLANIISPESK